MPKNLFAFLPPDYKKSVLRSVVSRHRHQLDRLYDGIAPSVFRGGRTKSDSVPLPIFERQLLKDAGHRWEFGTGLLLAWFEENKKLAEIVREQLVSIGVSEFGPFIEEGGFCWFGLEQRHIAVEKNEGVDFYYFCPNGDYIATADKVLATLMCAVLGWFEAGNEPTMRTNAELTATDSANESAFSQPEVMLATSAKDSLVSDSEGAMAAESSTKDEVDASLKDFERQIDELEIRHRELLAGLVSLGASVDLPLTADSGMSGSYLQPARKLLEEIRTANQRRCSERAEALSLLEAVSSLRCTEDISSVNVDVVRQKALDAAQRIKSIGIKGPSVEAISQILSPFSALHQIVSHLDHLLQSEEEFKRARSVVESTFGYRIETAAIQRKLAFGPSAENEVTARKERNSVVELNASPAVGRIDTKDQTSDESTNVGGASEEQTTLVLDAGTTQIADLDEDLEGDKGISDLLALPIDTLAGQALESDQSANTIGPTKAILWKLIAVKELSFAYQLARYGQDEIGQINSVLQPSLLRALLLAPYVDGSESEITRMIAQDWDSLGSLLADDRQLVLRQEFRLLMFAAVVRPAIFRPQFGLANSALRHARFAKPLEDVLIAVAQFAGRNVPVDAILLRGIHREGQIDNELRELRGKVDEWLNRAGSIGTHARQVQRIWRDICSRRSEFRETLDAIVDNDLDRLPLARRVLASWATESDIKRNVERIDRETRRIKHGVGLVGGAMVQLLAHISEATGFISQWIRLSEIAAEQPNSFVLRETRAFKSMMLELYVPASQLLADLSASHTNGTVRIAAERALDALEDVRRVFVPESESSPGVVDATAILGAALVRAGVRPLTDLLEPKGLTNAQVVSAILGNLQRKQVDWISALEQAIRAHDFVAADNIVRLHGQLVGDTSVRREIVRMRDESIRSCRAELQQRIRVARASLERIGRSFLYDSDEYTKHSAALGSLQVSAEVDNDIVSIEASLNDLESQLQEKEQNALAIARSRLKEADIDESDSRFKKIVGLLEQRKLIVAADIFESVIAGEEEASGTTRTDFLTDFIKASASISRFLADSTDIDNQMTRLLRNEVTIESLAVPELSARIIEERTVLLTSWWRMRSGGEKDKVKSVCEGLGFTGVDVSSVQKGMIFRVSCDRIEDRSRCPISTYGSDAHGSYVVICLSSGEFRELEQRLKAVSSSDAVIVFYFGRLDRSDRKLILKISNRLKRPFIVLDDVLMTFLALRRGDLLPVMYDVTLPFAWCKPFYTTGGSLPAEMFFGRTSEMQRVKLGHGGCFLYGGRQLGKTALLRAVEGDYNTKEDGRVCVYLDLIRAGVGYTRPPQYVFDLVANELKKKPEFFETLDDKRSFSGATLLVSIEGWLKANTSRRLLVLLDEADKFFEKDAQSGLGAQQVEPFSTTRQLQVAMEATERRFKVVFAGLHNVQRATQIPNHPLAKMGDPICVGPLLTGDNRTEAQNLLKIPFWALGYRLSEDAVRYVLYHATYIPLLIQIAAEGILDELRNRTDQREEEVPPIVISLEEIEELLTRETKTQMVSKFGLTLGMDRKFKIISLAMASLQGDGRRHFSSQLSVDDIRSAAIGLDERVFANYRTTDAFRSILLELEELGVLSSTDHGRYFGFRNEMVAKHLGSADSLFESIPVAEDVPDSVNMSMSNRHRVLYPGRGTFLSPLTVYQTNQLVQSSGIAVVTGMPIAGTTDIGAALEAELWVGKELLNQKDLEHLDDFLEALREMRKSVDQRNRKCLLVAEANAVWSVEWLDHAIDCLAKHRKRDAGIGLVLTSDVGQTWTFSCDADQRARWQRCLDKGVVRITLEPYNRDSLQEWYQSLAIPCSEEMFNEIAMETGLWHVPLEIVVRKFIQQAGNLREGMESVRKLLSDEKLWGKWLGETSATSRAFGVLRLWGEYDKILGFDDVAYVCGERCGLDNQDKYDMAEMVVKWGEEIGILKLRDGRRYELDDLLYRLIKKSAS